MGMLVHWNISETMNHTDINMGILENNQSYPFFNDTSPIQKHPSLVLLLSIFAMATIWGNTLVILAVLCRPNLHTPTGHFVLSLAVADLIVGLAVMPFNIIFEMYDQVWIFSLTACDLWHSLDVLASTASIWNLCVIAVDRCLAVTDPLKYRQLMNRRRWMACIGLVWVGSSLIAFPAIGWWRRASPELYLRSDRCSFTDDTGYLLFSSLLSFYGPLLIIVGAYGRVYLIASNRQRALAQGRQPLPSNPTIYIRIHRGGQADQNGHCPVVTQEDNDTTALKDSKRGYNSYHSLATPKISSVQSASIRSNPSDSGRSHYSRKSGISADVMARGESKRRRKPRTSLIARLLAKESKAAKTLGIVVGAFVACWLPFFVVNVISGACGKKCNFLSDHDFRLLFTTVTWLGHCNSFLNPIIYTCSNREFRDAFAYVLFCGKCTQRGRAYTQTRRFHQSFMDTNGQTFCARKELAKAIQGGLKVIVPQAISTEESMIVVPTSPSTMNQEENTKFESTSDQITKLNSDFG